MTSNINFRRMRTSTKPVGLMPATTVSYVDLPTVSQVEAAKNRASEKVRSWADRSKGRLTDIGVYKTGHRYDNIVKYLANFHDKPAVLLPEIQRNLKALLNLEMQRAALEYDFHQELFRLKRTLHPANREIMERRTEIVSGKIEPEGSWEHISSAKPPKQLTIDARIYADYLRGFKGLAHFWRCVFTSTKILRSLCTETDRKILENLKDVKSTPLATGGFQLEFLFDENEFMSDGILIKRFEGCLKIDQKRPYRLKGWSVDEISGCEIKWKEGMDPTLRQITRRRSDSTEKTIREPKFVKTKSFFNFFAKPKEDSTGLSERILLGTESQTAIGNYLYHKVIPNAVLLLIGEASDKLQRPWTQ